jgi:ribosomal-protein-alanine N-acetyltransferase
MNRFLESSKLILAPVTEKQIKGEEYTGWINDQEADRYTQHAIFPQSQEKLNLFFESRTTSRQILWLAILAKPEMVHIGSIDISAIDYINKTGVYNILIGNKSFRGAGLGYHASHLLINHAFQRLNLNRIQLGVHQDNLAAIALYKKLGFRQEGIMRDAMYSNGAFVNIISMSVLAAEYTFDNSIL